MYYRRNYGGVLQSYALFHTLKRLGHDVEIINYKGTDTISSYHPVYILQFFCNKIASLFHSTKANSVKTKPLSKDMLEVFSDFKTTYLHYSEEANQANIASIVNNYDAGYSEGK